MIAFPVTFNYEDKDFEASVSEIPHPDKQLQVTIQDETLIEQFGESFTFLFTPRPNEFSFIEPQMPGGKDFMKALLSGVKNYLQSPENNNL